MLPIVTSPEFAQIFSGELSTLLQRATNDLETLVQEPASTEKLSDLHAAYHSMGSMGGMARTPAIERVGRLFERLTELADFYVATDPEKAQAVFIFCQTHLPAVREVVGDTLASRTASADARAEQVRSAAHRVWGAQLAAAAAPAATPLAPKADFGAMLPASPRPGAIPLAVGPLPIPVADHSSSPAADTTFLPLDEVKAPTVFASHPSPSGRPVPLSPADLPASPPAPKSEEEDILDFLAEVGAGGATPPTSASFVAPVPPLDAGASPVGAGEASSPSPAFSAPREEHFSPSRPAFTEPASAAGHDVFPAPLTAAPSFRPRAATPAVDLEMLQFFIPETEEYCEQMEQVLDDWQRRPFDTRAQDTLMRLFHTIKGAANSIGLVHLGRLAHEMEELFLGIDERNLQVPHGAKLDLCADAALVLRRALRRAGAQPPDFTPPPELDDLIRRVERTRSAAVPAVRPSEPAADAAAATPFLPVEVAPGEAIETAPVEYSSATAEDAALEAWEISPAQTSPSSPSSTAVTDGEVTEPATTPESSGSTETFATGTADAAAGDQAGATPVLETPSESLLAFADLPPLTLTARLAEPPPPDPSELHGIEVEAFRSFGAVEEPSFAPAFQPPEPDWKEAFAPAAASVAPPAEAVEEAALAPVAPEPITTRTTIDASTDEPFLESQTAARIEPARLDLLMNLVGELIVGRNQLQSRLQGFNQVQRELEATKNRLLDIVNDFQEKYEYSALPGASGASLPGGLANDDRLLARPTVRGPASVSSGEASAGPAGLGAPFGFSELEFDRYDALNILCRALVEIGNDANEIIVQSGGFISAFNDETDRFSRTANRLQDIVTQVRLSPLEALFRRLGRVVTDTAGREGKAVRWVAQGGSTKLDRVIIDQIFQPLLHLVRNAVSHGVEDAEIRAARRKPAEGVVTVRASQRAGQVVLELEDDGGGLDLGAIRRRAVERGLLTADAEPDETRLVNFIFQTGFSTARQVTDVSGRGIGMDVVRREVARLNGTIEIKSRAGQGCIITLRLPVTLSVNQAVILGVGAETYALPANFLERVVVWHAHDLSRRPDGVEELAVGERRIPFVRLDALLGAPPATDRAPGQERQAVIVQLADQFIAFGADRNLGRADIVVKSLGPVFAGHPLLSGGTIGPDGRVILLLDVPSIAQGLLEKRGLVALVLADATAAPIEEPPAPVGFDRRAAPPVLIVDDSLSIRKVAEKYVGELGWRTETAADGMAALEKLRRGQYSMVLTDLEMPRMHGFELLAAIRADESMRDLPVLVVTSRAADKHRQQARELGATDYITKPFSKDQLAEKIEAHLPASASA